MNRSTSDAPLPKSPLHAVHAQQRAAFGDVDGWEMPRVFTNIKREYLSAKGTVALMDRSQHGRLRVSGAQRLALLNRLTTQDLRALSAGQGARTVLLSDKGRILDDLRLFARQEDLIMVTSPGNQAFVQSTIEKLRFRDDVTLEDLTAGTAMISAFGPQSAHLLEGLARHRHLDALELHHHVDLQIAGAACLAAKTAGVGGAGFDLIVAADSAPRVWSALLDEGGSYGVSPLGEEGYEMLRIEQGVPRFGRELTDEYNPLEAGLETAISWTKGCYVGQEVVARLDSRQKVGKHLVGLWLDPGPVPEAGSALEAESHPGQAIGKLTSVAPSIDLRRVIGLGYVRTEHATPGVRLVVSGEDRIGAEVAEIPFRAPMPAGAS